MLLTGFDAPVEQMMYLDKPLRDHNLLQAIARTNRIYPNKGCGKIIDYYGMTRNLEKALDFDESVVDSAMLNIDHIKERFTETLDEILRLFANVNIEDPSMDNLRYCLKIFIDSEDKQQFFIDRYGKLKMFFEILSPDPFLKQSLRKFEWVTSFYLAFSKEFLGEEYSMHELAEYGQKLKELIQEKVDYEGITKNFRELKINEIYTLQQLEKMDDEEQALNLEKMLKREISVNIDTDPVFKRFSERLSAIRKEFEQNQIDLSERIKRYYELLNDVKKKGNEAEDLGLNLREYGLYVVSEEFVKNFKEPVFIEFIKELTLRLDAVLDSGWQESSKRDEFIKDVKRAVQEVLLKEYGGKLEVNDFNKYLNRLVDIVIKKF
jgi:type I restriction enzyme R subunit